MHRKSLFLNDIYFPIIQITKPNFNSATTPFLTVEIPTDDCSKIISKGVWFAINVQKAIEKLARVLH
jgi:hypothetical protein